MPRYRDIQIAFDELMQATERDDHAQVQVIARRYACLVVQFAGGRVDVSRAFLLPTVFAVLRRLERKHPIRLDALDQMGDAITQRIEAPANPAPLIESFQLALAHLATLGTEVQGPKLVRFEAALRYLRQNFSAPLRLREVARKSGFSVPSFVRMFRTRTGTTYLKFVRERRVEFARRLLTTTSMTIEQVAISSGFRSSRNLIRSFRIVLGRTPGGFRLASRRAPAKESAGPLVSPS